MSVYLPQEIVELILDQLKDSRSTLLQCSLVSRAWRIRSQYLLFLRLRLAFQTSWDFPDGRNILNNHQPGEKFMGYIYRLEKTLLSNNCHRFQCAGASPSALYL
ncbi:hypothetical protein BT96DRAFT_990226 [Gymnopus androsaceus JB14]|uniref:F-box domain-containing protein n=1 Tax=Gymnopus androsaceus JB14 TaxID=1447944 RepID=A0A6A4I2C0_9AGAR|nr:hypothetical protein BT96DRAFT_990226 [Gymnopus androsaceus JB14]